MLSSYHGHKRHTLVKLTLTTIKQLMGKLTESVLFFPKG